MRIDVIQHVDFEDAGAIADWAAERGHELAIAMAVTADFGTPDDYDMLVIMGGPMGANDEATNPWLIDEKRAVAAAVAAGKRVLGVCLGAQIVASALGAEVKRNPELEIGYFPLTLSFEGRSSAVSRAIPEGLVVGHWHGDTFALPDGAVRLARSAACANQAFEYAGGRVVGLQCHLEWTAESIRALIEHAGGSLSGGGEHVWPAEAIVSGEARHGARCREVLYAVLDAMAD
ncbi:MAG: type 1 glutamine amidotransferase [Coriobacteriia bacterium]